MKLVIVTSDGPEHRYVVNQIAAQHPVAAVFICDRAKKRSWRKVLLKSPRVFVGKALRAMYLKATRDENRRDQSIRNVLGDNSLAFAPDLKLRKVGKARGALLVEALTELQPDVIAVYGTSVIPDTALAVARYLALNMHTGMSPWYRGTACAFWPLVRGEFDKLGATVHECTSKLDGGRIFFRAQALPICGDDIHAVFSRTVIVGAKGYVDVLAQAARRALEGSVQDLTLGHEYTGAQIGLRAELAARRAMARFNAASGPARQ